ncbi:MAG TPA: amidohydrolase [Gemmatimonadales bacterium]|nr:amidohydrolase [Gemmatimonadales bacterium]
MIRLRGAWCAVALGGLAAGGTGCSRPAETLIVNGLVWTGASSGHPHPGAVAIRGERILAVGDSAEVAARVGRGARVIDARGGLVMPGFADGHTHFIDGGFQLANVDLRDAATPREFVRRLAEYARRLGPGEWITGGDWDHELWRGAPLPRRDWIDSVTPDNPVFVNRLDGHMALANSAALRAAGVTRETAPPPGGEMPRDPATGEPIGIFKDQAMGLITRAIPPPPPERRDSALARALAHAAALGVTAVAHMSASWADWASYRRLADAGRLTLRVAVFFDLAEWRAVADTVARAGKGDDRLWIGGVKGYVDGSAGSRTALFFEPYADSAGYTGLMQTGEADLRAWIGGADSAGLQVAVHAIGDRANALLLAILDSITRAHDPRDRRFRDEHAQHLRPEDIPRFAEIPVVASMQPYHAIDDGRWLDRRIGPRRSRTTYAFRDLLDAGAPLAFGSDWTVAPLDPLLGVYAAVTRRTLDGRHPRGWVPEQKITVGEALRAYTGGNAWALFAEHKWGTLAPGYYADVVVLDRDLFAIPPERIPEAKVLFTIVNGAIVYPAYLKPAS